MKRTTADFLWILKRGPLRTIRFTTIRSGLIDCTDPLATSACDPSLCSRNNNTDDDGNMIGANTVAITTDSGRKNRSNY